VIFDLLSRLTLLKMMYFSFIHLLANLIKQSIHANKEVIKYYTSVNGVFSDV
jgi:hypothetical protein